MKKGWLDNVLKQARMTPAQLASIAHIDPGVISRLRRTPQEPTFSTLKSIQKASKVPMRTILEYMGLLEESSPDEVADRQINELLEQLSLEEKEKEIRRLTLNLELENEERKSNAKPNRLST